MASGFNIKSETALKVAISGSIYALPLASLGRVYSACEARDSAYMHHWRQYGFSGSARMTLTVQKSQCRDMFLQQRADLIVWNEFFTAPLAQKLSEQGTELVRRMMAFARQQELTPSSVDPASLCESVAGLVTHTLGGKVTVKGFPIGVDIQYHIRLYGELQVSSLLQLREGSQAIREHFLNQQAAYWLL